MFKHSLLLLAIFCLSHSADAQSSKCYRYKDLIFSDVKIIKDLNYATSNRTDEKKFHSFDLYQPAGDEIKGRPLIIWMHGGGFKYGTKEAKGTQLWCKTFAQRGYVCAAVNYTLSKKNPVFKFPDLTKATYNAVQDVRTAMIYFKAHYKEYGIDPDKIILAGNSAGGMLALHTAYCSNAELAKIAKLDTANAAGNGRVRVAGVINFWGAIFDLSWLNNAKVPIVSALGSKDGIVPTMHKDTLPLHGGIDIQQKATALGIPNDLKIFKGFGHELQRHFNPFFAPGKPTQKRWLEAGQFAADFLYENVVRK